MSATNPTQSEIILARYKRIEREADDFGRVIGVRKLRPSEQTKLAGMTPDLDGISVVVGPDGEKHNVSVRLPLAIAAAVCEINNAPIPFARTRGELDAVFDMLDEEGLAAASRAIAKLSKQSSDAPAADSKETAKN